MEKHHPLHILILAIGFILGTIVLVLIIRNAVAQSKDSGFHEHADFALFINGQQFDFSEDRYMSIEPCSIETSFIPSAHAHGGEVGNLEASVHLHNNKGGTIHVHKPSITYEDFFNSLGMVFHDTEFVDADGNHFEENEEKEFKFIVNGEEVDSIKNMEIRNLDRALISYGNKSRNMNDLMQEYGYITNDACINSKTCLHREPAEPEKCGYKKESFLLKMIGL